MTDQLPHRATDNDALEKRNHATGYLAHPAFPVVSYRYRLLTAAT